MSDVFHPNERDMIIHHTSRCVVVGPPANIDGRDLMGSATGAIRRRPSHRVFPVVEPCSGADYLVKASAASTGMMSAVACSARTSYVISHTETRPSMSASPRAFAPLGGAVRQA